MVIAGPGLYRAQGSLSECRGFTYRTGPDVTNDSFIKRDCAIIRLCDIPGMARFTLLARTRKQLEELADRAGVLRSIRARG
jgi:hypothetical protein